ncbi:hypothetical protein [Nostoc sphaeroides]|uniref:Uncharacterized protein n=1 Tax=Nostoc sphaeroides CCNUC1 TaxID=2653204 RepID=A0A5P8VZ85_9NOSO|nr:hypothetical protein [Nostoc sphaeroides]QFS45366.1 hypothetical protein GXM_02843 [Nostoc sphaeroides CCNUC1]
MVEGESHIQVRVRVLKRSIPSPNSDEVMSILICHILARSL